MKININQLLIAAAMSLFAFTTEARIEREDRALVVVSELQEHGPQKLRGLYSVIEDLTSHLSSSTLSDDYRQIFFLRRSDATVANFKNRLQALSKDPRTKAIDVIFSLHGSDGRVYFYEGGINMSALVNQMTAVSPTMNSAQVSIMKRKLRMIYNLSCFGRSHNSAFISMGFDVSVGSRGINANSEVEFPSVLNQWSFGWKFVDTFSQTNNDFALAAADTPVQLAGIPADSKKFFQGRTALTISTDPQ